jgi:CheY-like chemotaxis protein
MSTILVVDDEPQLRLLYAEFLDLLGFRICTARNGTEALAMVEQERPQLILLDVEMPGMNGIEVLCRLRAEHFGGKVLMMSGSWSETVMARAYELGVARLVSKPFGLDQLEQAVRDSLSPTGRWLTPDEGEAVLALGKTSMQGGSL